LKRKNKNAARRRNVSRNGLHSADFGLKGKLNKAGLLHRSGRLTEAEDVYKEILNIAPDHADILNLLGLTLFQKREHNAAAGFIKKAIQINPSNPLYYINLGNTFHGLNKEDEAANAYRMPLFSIKPAPIQVSNLGYPNTTGLTSMDYRLTDARADPPGLTDHLYSEKLVRLPHTFLCYTPPGKSPEIETTANRNSGQIIFGSFNNRTKITPEVVKAWAKILTQVPDGRIILKSWAFADPETRKILIDLFVENGVERGRIELVSRIPSMFDHLQLYNRIDIGLDTFPYNGTTTTCEALWMGVPVITLAGKTHRSRVGASLLSNVGLEEFIAESVEDYVEKGVSLANNVKKRKSIHRDLRSWMARSLLMDSARFIRSLEKTYHWMFNEWLGPSGMLSK
jgi:predicted O-linked N-acetylglucosamine transferase (SPINDLY family)